MELTKIKSSEIKWGDAARHLNNNFDKIEEGIETIKGATTRNKGYYSSYLDLITAFPTASVGDIAYVDGGNPYKTYRWNGSAWAWKNDTGGSEQVELGNYYTRGDTDTLMQFSIHGTPVSDPASILD